MANPKITIALSHYDRHVPFFDGTVQAEGIDLNVLIVGQSDRQRDGEERHERMLQKGEFDVAELSLSSYLMAKSRGMPFTAIPVFPRRLFSHSQMWINVDAGINEPKDLIGKKVGLHSFQNTLATLSKGDLQSEFDVPWRKIHWLLSKKDNIEFEPEKGVKIDQLTGERQRRRHARERRDQRHDDAAPAQAGACAARKKSSDCSPIPKPQICATTIRTVSFRSCMSSRSKMTC